MDDFEATYYPTIYTICPSKILVESGQITSENHAEILFANDCAAATQDNDAAMLNYTGETITCGGNPSAISARMTTWDSRT